MGWGGGRGGVGGEGGVFSGSPPLHPPVLPKKFLTATSGGFCQFVHQKGDAREVQVHGAGRDDHGG